MNALALGGIPDHLHLLSSLPANSAVPAGTRDRSAI